MYRCTGVKVVYLSASEEKKITRNYLPESISEVKGKVREKLCSCVLG